MQRLTARLPGTTTVEATGTAPSLPYHEPGIVTILTLSSFLLLLNIIYYALDRLVYCGLLGQVFIGIAWGTPGAEWLSIEVEEVIVQLGYLGLLLLVYEGGLSTSFKSLKANLALSAAVALTGIAVPIGLSYTLQPLLGATALQAFAAGAALCSTSLGTTFTVLASSGLSSTRLGVILTSAAMMDDVVGLVMVQVISNLGGGSIDAITVVRPVFVSLAFALLVPLTCLLIIKPSTLLLNRYRKAHPTSWIAKSIGLEHTAFVIHNGLLIALVTGASYAGTSNLFAAYIAGAVISWWDTNVPHQDNQSNAQASAEKKLKGVKKHNSNTPLTGEGVLITQNNVQIQTHEEADLADRNSGSIVYERYYQQAVSRILRPLFFASIGFSIPVTRMFRGSIVWRGIVYAVLMSVGKLVCGLWLVRFSMAPFIDYLQDITARVRLPCVPHVWGKETAIATRDAPSQSQPSGQDTPAAGTEVSAHILTVPKPFSLQPALILACAMTARGEIGFLISAVAESKGIFSSAGTQTNSESDLFLIVTWAIVLCTITGPLGVGLSVRRVKELEARKNTEREGAGRDVLGVWGVE